MQEDKFIPGYDNMYAISKDGTITSFHKGKILYRKPHVNTSGYLHVRLLNKGIDKSVSVHILIAQAFIPNPENLPTVNHKDGNKLNNSIENLEWCSHSDNQKHAYKTGLRISAAGVKNCKAKLDDNKVLEIYKSSFSNDDLAIIYGVSKSTIDKIKTKKLWKHVLQ